MASGIGPCVEWPQATSANGYGVTWRGGKTVGAHRATYEDANGPIPVGLVVRHRCDNKRCVRLDHLELGTPADNSRDMVERGRSRGGRPPDHDPTLYETASKMVTAGFASADIARTLGVGTHLIHKLRHGKLKHQR